MGPCPPGRERHGAGAAAAHISFNKQRSCFPLSSTRKASNGRNGYTPLDLSACPLRRLHTPSIHKPTQMTRSEGRFQCAESSQVLGGASARGQKNGERGF